MDKESYFALVAQHIPQLTLKIQHQLLEVTGSYTNLFMAGTLSDELVSPAQSKIEELQAYYQSRRAEFKEKLCQVDEILAKNNAQVLSCTSEHYPPLLKEIKSAPPLLYVQGSLENLYLPQIAIVGSRGMTRGGEELARQWSEFFAANGFVITSGLALGIDGVAHRGALQAEAGKTIAVTATGVDSVYPKKHRELAERILSCGGTVVTEFPPGTAPIARNFPRRNRIISGLSLGVLVIEAAIKSGSLITARYALEQNREVFAVPGSIHNPLSKGCHYLIKQGAHLVETATDVVTELGAGLSGLVEIGEKLPQELPEPEQYLLSVMGFDPIDVDSLCANAEQNAAEVLPLLSSLELKGLIENINGLYTRLA